MARMLLAVILLVLLPCSAPAQTSPPLYHYVDLGVLPGGASSYATSLISGGGL
jgi:hypothetical protein